MKKDLKEIAIKMRLNGMSYTQIKNVVNVSKSTLSIWLQDYPLSVEKLKELRDYNPIRIEKYRNTRLRQREKILENVFVDVSKDIGKLSKRDLFIAGLFLYWGEGTKSSRDLVAFTNTDPSMIRFFIKWIRLFGIKNDQLKIKLHLYSDMNISEKVDFWSKFTNIPKLNFKKPYIKDSKYSEITYKNKYGHGTCSVMFGSTSLYNKIIMGIKYIKSIV